jgi:DNA-binding NarL/FixJ family response regulator
MPPSGDEALHILANERPSVILMDRRMPGQSGIEVTRLIKASHSGIPIVILSAHDHPQYRIEAVGAGATAYVLKEMIGKDLGPLLRSLLEMEIQNNA